MAPPLRRWTLASAVLILSMGAFSAIPAYRGIVKWRACSLASQALQAVEKPDMEKAFSLVCSAYRLRPMEPEVLRAVARICELRGDPMAVQFWQILSASPAATEEDHQHYIKISLDRQIRSPKNNELLEMLLKSDPQNATNWLLKARTLELDGHMSQAQNAARRAVALDAGSEEAVLYLARLLWEGADTHQESVRLLESLSAKPGQNGLAAASILMQQQEMAPELMQRLKTRLEQDPLGTVNHRLMALELALRISPKNADALLALAVEKYRKSGGDDLSAFGAWLNSHGVSAMAEQAISREEAMKNRKLFLVYLDALAAQKKWKDVESAVSAPGSPLEKSVIQIFRARCAQELGENERAADHWRAAQSATLGEPEQAMYVARYARQFGRNSQAESIYRTLTLNGSTARAAYVELLGLAAGQGTRAVRTLLKEMLTRWPKDDPVQNDYAYCCLLLGEEIGKSREIALELVKNTPGMIAYRTTLALAWLRSGKPEEALAVYRGLNVEWTSAPSSFRAIAAAVFWANGLKADARKMVGTIHLDDLREEEQALVRFPND